MNRSSTVDSYIASFDESTQAILKKIRALITDFSPEASESISYGMPSYKLGKYPLIYFAGFKNHIGVYPALTGDKEFDAIAKKFRTGKGTLQFPLNKEIPYDLILKFAQSRFKNR